MEIRNVTVLGLGIMGHGIAQVAAQSGFNVFAYDINDEAINKGLAAIHKSLERMTSKGKIDEAEAKNTLARIHASADLGKVIESTDFIMEAIPEVIDLKKDLFRKITKSLRPEVIIASNTSQFSISDLASATDRPDRFIGMHWFNPPQVMRLVEIVRGLETSDATLAAAQDLCKRFGKKTVVCRKDMPGFITTRMINAFLAEAYRIVEDGVATPADVDEAVRLAFNYPMGPLELADFSGLDTALRTATSLAEAYGDHFRPTPTFKNLVRAGHLGRKTGKGWHRY
jgi:3-hydroxybutyryl-CoA dehydrogenase